jgi:hypothetical protein
VIEQEHQSCRPDPWWAYTAYLTFRSPPEHAPLVLTTPPGRDESPPYGGPWVPDLRSCLVGQPARRADPVRAQHARPQVPAQSGGVDGEVVGLFNGDCREIGAHRSSEPVPRWVSVGRRLGPGRSHERPPVAQWIRATDFGSVGRGFESLRAGHDFTHESVLSRVDRAGEAPRGTAASSRCPRARRCGSARRTGRRG